MNKTSIRDLIRRAEELATDIETMRDDAQAEWDERSERWQESDKGTDAQEAIDQLDTAADYINDAVTEMENLL